MLQHVYEASERETILGMVKNIFIKYQNERQTEIW